MLMRLLLLLLLLLLHKTYRKNRGGFSLTLVLMMKIHFPFPLPPPISRTRFPPFLKCVIWGHYILWLQVLYFCPSLSSSMTELVCQGVALYKWKPGRQSRFVFFLSRWALDRSFIGVGLYFKDLACSRNFLNGFWTIHGSILTVLKQHIRCRESPTEQLASARSWVKGGLGKWALSHLVDKEMHYLVFFCDISQ